MIHLDTNYLIGLLVKGSPEANHVDVWLTSGKAIAASAIAWTEFLNGPVTPLEVSRAEAVLQSRIIPFGRKEAALAAELFNQTGRRRASRFDCLVGATAIIA
jgi:predicted nucleic acid-binding protein